MSIQENKPRITIDQDASDETVGYKPKGYELMGETFLICPSCDKKLVSFVLVQKIPENSQNLHIFQALHTKCGVKSFKLKINGYKFIYQAVPPFSITDIDTYDNNTEFIVK